MILLNLANAGTLRLCISGGISSCHVRTRINALGLMKLLFISLVVAGSASLMFASSAIAQTSSGFAGAQAVSQIAGNHASWQGSAFSSATNYPGNPAVHEIRDDAASGFLSGEANSSDSGAPGLTRLSAR